MSTKTENYDVLIAGQGAAAFAAGLYAARYQMKSIIIGETFGGETATGGLIENYPGYADIDGFDLMMKFREQVASYDVPILDDKVTTVAKNSNDFKIETESVKMYYANSVILGIGRERRKQKTVLRYSKKRTELKRIIKNPNSSDEERAEAQIKLQKLPRDANPIRMQRRCAITGRPHAVYRKFGLGRNKLRELAMKGDIPGLVKSSW